MRRQGKAKNIKAELDKEALRNKPLVIAARRKEFNFRKGQTYGRWA